MDFFEKAFQWLADLSQKLPAVDTNLFFIVVLAVIFGLGIVIAFTLLGSRARKLFVSARKIRKYLANVDTVDDDNVSDFTAHCFSKNTPQPLRDAWVQYLGVRFGYPSDIVSDSAVYDKFVKKNRDVRSGVFIGISLVLLAFFAFWGYGVLPAAEMGVVHLAALALIGVMYLVLVILARKQNQRCFETFDAMQEDLDAKVNLQIDSNFATDSSPLQELNSLVEEIIARNTAKVVDEDDEQTPIEALIEQKLQEQNEFDDEDEQENIDEIVSAQEEAQEENAQDGDVESEQRRIDELLQEQEEQLEETANEESQETEDAIDGSDEQVEEQENIDELLQEQEEELEEKAQEESDETELEIESADETLADDTQESETEQSVEEQEDEQPETVDETQNFDEEENEDNVEYTQSEETDAQEEETEESDEQESAEEETEDEQENVEKSAEESAEEVNDEDAEDNAESDEAESADADDEEVEESDEDESEEVEEAKEDEEPEVVYVVDEEDEEENAKPAKLVKLPNLVDYMLSKNMPKSMKIQIATMLISTYNKFKDSKEDRKIVVSCLSKVMRDLQQEN